MTNASGSRWAPLLDVLRRIDRGRPRDDGRTTWTAYVGRHLKRAAPAGTTFYQNYLADFTWCYQLSSRSLETYKGIKLAVECEWTPTLDAFWDDFTKLPDIQADKRMFIGHLRRCHGGGTLKDDVSALTRGIERFLARHHHLGRDGEVLVALWDFNDKEAPLEVRLFNGARASMRLPMA